MSNWQSPHPWGRALSTSRVTVVERTATSLTHCLTFCHTHPTCNAVNCDDEHVSDNNHFSCELLLDVTNYVFQSREGYRSLIAPSVVARDCAEVQGLGWGQSGVYEVCHDPLGLTGCYQVRCELTTDGGGWTVGTIIYHSYWLILRME